VKRLRVEISFVLAAVANRVLDLATWVSGEYDDFKPTVEELHQFEAWQAAHRREEERRG
jgi:hypothetical protein